MRGRPVCVCVVRADLQVNQVVLAAVVPSHRRKGFPIDALFINAQAAPLRLVLKNLMCKLVNAGTGFAGASVTGNKPTTTKLITFPGQTAKSCDARFDLCHKQKPQGDQNEQNAANEHGLFRIGRQPVDWETHWIEWSEAELHGHTLPMRYPASRLARAAKIAAARVILAARCTGGWVWRTSNTAVICC